MSALYVLLSNLLVASGPAAGPVDFDTQIIPVLTKAGCNAGACHGGAAGRGGFKLSLLGGDPAADHLTIVKEYEGRRINLARPAASLLLLKPLGSMQHGGDIRLEYDGAGARLIEAWIGAGAPRLGLRRLEKLLVTPVHHVATEIGEKVPLRAMALFDDGVRTDVTRWTVFTASDPGRLQMEEEVNDGELLSVATTKRRGQSVVVARFLAEVVPVRITVPLGDEPVDLSGEPRHNFIDDDVLETLETLRLRPAPQATDDVYLRRARLRLTGTLPSIEEVRDFVASDAPRRRAALVDRLLESPEFTEYWTYRLATLFRVRSLARDTRVAETFHDWLRRQLASRAPYDDMARALLTAEGDSHQRGEAGFYRMTAGPREHAEYVSETFLGARLKCANCHNHPLDRWTQDDYHGLAAVFARVDRSRVVKLKERGDVTHPRTGKPAVPRLPGERFLAPGRDARGELADWLTSPDNPYFAHVVVNRLWRALMGRGLVEPVDDLRATNPASHPRLLERLARDFVESDFDLRHTLRVIANSAAFGRAAAPAALLESESDERYYAHARGEPMQPEVLADAIAAVTGVSDRYGDREAGTRAISLPDPKIPARGLDLLGRCSREASCASAPAGVGLTAKLHILNGPLMNRKIAAREGRLARLIEAGRGTDEIVEEFYLRALGRLSGAEERAFWTAELGARQGEPRREALEDFLWSLLNSREFVAIY